MRWHWPVAAAAPAIRKGTGCRGQGRPACGQSWSQVVSFDGDGVVMGNPEADQAGRVRGLYLRPLCAVRQGFARGAEARFRRYRPRVVQADPLHAAPDRQRSRAQSPNVRGPSGSSRSPTRPSSNMTPSLRARKSLSRGSRRRCNCRPNSASSRWPGLGYRPDLPAARRARRDDRTMPEQGRQCRGD